jgi:hypothetical protein
MFAFELWPIGIDMYAEPKVACDVKSGEEEQFVVNSGVNGSESNSILSP